MNKGQNAITQEAMAAVNAAKSEAPFTANDLLQEIAPLLEAYFMGEVKCSDEAIRMEFYNGQRFEIKAVEEVRSIG